MARRARTLATGGAFRIVAVPIDARPLLARNFRGSGGSRAGGHAERHLRLAGGCNPQKVFARSIVSISRVQALPALAANLVFGLGLPQVLEFHPCAAKRSHQEGAIGASRMFAALRLVSRNDCYRLVLGRDVAGAADAVESVLARSA